LKLAGVYEIQLTGGVDGRQRRRRWRLGRLIMGIGTTALAYLERFTHGRNHSQRRRLAVKAAIVTHPNQTPTYDDFGDPPAQNGFELITVTASALSPLTKSRAAGSHYTSTATFPMVVGVDGVGTTGNGRRVYFCMPAAPFGGMAERTLVPIANCVALPEDLDDVTAAALANPGMSSVLALKTRAGLRRGDTVLINGATGTAGTLAVQLAKYLGAGKVVATGRDATALQRLADLGADVTISLTDDPQKVEDSFVHQLGGGGGVDVVLDYLYGQSAETLLAAIGRTRGLSRPLRYVSIGAVSAQQITLPSAVMRGTPLVLMGSGIGGAPWGNLISAAGEALHAALAARLYVDTTPVPLADVNRTWNADTGKSRLVFVVGGSR
jgi:NADPH:quinone reductase-like Zn-dependent oxidoreductase